MPEGSGIIQVQEGRGRFGRPNTGRVCWWQVIAAEEEHTATLIYLHGFGSQGPGRGKLVAVCARSTPSPLGLPPPGQRRLMCACSLVFPDLSAALSFCLPASPWPRAGDTQHTLVQNRVRTRTKPTSSSGPGAAKLVQCRFGTGGRAGRGWQAGCLDAPELRRHGGKSCVGSSIALRRLRRHGATCARCAPCGLDAHQGRFDRCPWSFVYHRILVLFIITDIRAFLKCLVNCLVGNRRGVLPRIAHALAANSEECLMAFKARKESLVKAHKASLVSPFSLLLSCVRVRVRQTKHATWVTSNSSSPLKSVQVLSRVCAAVLCAPNALPPTPSFSLSFPYQCLRSRVCARAGQVKTHVCVCRSCAGQDKLVCVKRWQRCVSCV